MNKFLYCFILILLLNQCLSIDCNAEESSVPCSQREVSSSLNKCTQTSENGEIITCSEEPKTCDDIISDATITICQEFEDANNKCEHIPENTPGEDNQNAHCKSVPKACSDSLGDVSTGQEEICSQRDKNNGLICYFDGNSACKEASNCEQIVLSDGKTVSQTTCDKYNTNANAQKKCVVDGNKCKLVEKEVDKTSEKSSGEALTLSFAILILTLVI